MEKREQIASKIAMLEAELTYHKTQSDTLKIVANGSYGKLGSKWSILYAPHLLIQTTLTGQLVLLMLIEMLEKNRIPVVSANTDGIVIKCPRASVEKMQRIIAWWEKETGYTMEYTHYASLFSKSVNSYIALKEKGGVKRKGEFASPGLQKNPSNLICVEAVCDYLEHGIPLDYTIYMCDDIRKFVTIKRVSGGGIKGGKEILKEVDGPKGKVMKFSHYEGGTYLGKAVRWYYAVGETGCIHYKTNGNRVGRSEGAKPLMQLPDRMPDDIDYAWYVKEAEAILKDIGAI